MEPTTSALLSRIERLEASNARQRFLSLFSFAACAVLLFTAASPSGPLVVNGTNGQSIHIDGDSIGFWDSSGTNRLRIGFSSSRLPVVDVRDTSGRMAASFGVSSDGGPQMTMFDESGTKRTFVGRYTDRSYGTFVADSSGTYMWHAP